MAVPDWLTARVGIDWSQWVKQPYRRAEQPFSGTDSRNVHRDTASVQASDELLLSRRPGSGWGGIVVPELARRGLIGTDIERYSRRGALDQHEAQRVYDREIRGAASDAGLATADWLRQPAGDGEFAILPDGVHEPKVIAVLLGALAARLREYNRTRTADFRVRVRVAIHHGLIHLDGATGFPGPAAVVVARLLASEPVRDVLRQRPDTNLAAIISGEVYEEIVVHRYEGLRPELFRQVDVCDRSKGFSHRAWVHAPEDDVTRPVWFTPAAHRLLTHTRAFPRAMRPASYRVVRRVPDV